MRDSTILPAAVPGPPETINISATAELRHQCPFVLETDAGSVTINWSTCGNTIELHSLAEYLHQFATWEISHEDLTDQIKHDIDGVQGIFATSVSTTWETAGMDVACSTSPILVPRP
jgi:NADPH-dependent 7-cyano-7-deazaguanine reductase QueF